MTNETGAPRAVPTRRALSPIAPITLLAVAWMLGGPVASAGAQDPQGAVFIRAGTVFTMEGPAIQNGEVLIEKGRVTAVGKDLRPPKNARVISYPKAVVAPGFIDAGSYTGIFRNRDERTRPLLPDLLAADAFNPFDPGLAAALRAGITTMHIMQGDQDVVGGQTAVVEVLKDGRARFLEQTCGVKVSLSVSSWPRNRQPTSVEGAFDLIRNGRGSKVLAELRSGKRRAFVSVGRRSEVEASCRLRARVGAKGVIVGGPPLRFHARRIAENHDGAILLPVLPSYRVAERATAARLSEAGVRIAFSTTSPALAPESLRVSAVVARQAGLSKDAALRALTLDAAKILGVDDRVGSLASGKQADLVILSHEPTDVRARVLMVMQNGVVAHRLKETAK